jgi:hypothetical protein
VGDDSDHGDLIGGTHIHEPMSVDVFVPKLGPSKSNSFMPTIQLFGILQSQGLCELSCALTIFLFLCSFMVLTMLCLEILGTFVMDSKLEYMVERWVF